jgi:hypothetical protein
MKLRLHGNSLRLRLTRPEVMRLHEAGAVEESAGFGAGSPLIYRIESRAGADQLWAEFAGQAITVRVPAESVRNWAGTEEVGLYGQHGTLKIAVEKDFRCLTRRPEEQEADAYPHPDE